MRAQLGALTDEVDKTLDDLAGRDVLARMWDADHTVWDDDPTEITDRLGWLNAPGSMSAVVDEVDTAAGDIATAGFTDAVVLGMGGASLFADVVGRTFPNRRLRVHVLDSTDPAAILRTANLAPLEQTFFVVASKTGTTIETRSHLQYFWDLTGGRAEQFAVITDEGTPLSDLARERGFAHLFHNPADVGGRYSALTYFGLFPAALAGVDLEDLLARAARMAALCRQDTAPADNPGAWLGAVLGASVRAGRDKVTLLVGDELASFGAWLEQLLAESTGKRGTGVVPVVGEPPGDPHLYGDDRLFVALGRASGVGELAAAGHPVVELDVEEVADLGGEVFRWEFATAVAGAVMGVNPFDQPNVAEAKEATARALARGVPTQPTEPLDAVLDRVGPGDYLAVLAFVDPGAPVATALGRSRAALRDRLRVATTLGIGPRYLHSTGQLHKGGPPTGVFLQVVADDPIDLPIPGEAHGFSTLKRGQAAGDLETLRGRGLRAARIDLDELLRFG